MAIMETLIFNVQLLTMNSAIHYIDLIYELYFTEIYNMCCIVTCNVATDNQILICEIEKLLLDSIWKFRRQMVSGNIYEFFV